MADFKKVFSFPFQDKDWPTKLLIGILLGIFPIVRFFSMGYSYKVFKRTLNGGEPYLPEWENFGDLFFQGFKIAVIMLCYFIVPIVLSWTGLVYILIGAGGMLMDVLESAEAADYFIKGGLFYILGVITKIPPYLLWPMAFANYCRGGEKIRNAFKLWEIIPNIFEVTGDYILSILLIYAIHIVLFIVIMVGNGVVPFGGTLLNFMLSFYFHYLVFDALFGSVCSKAYADRSAPTDHGL